MCFVRLEVLFFCSFSLVGRLGGEGCLNEGLVLDRVVYTA